MKFKQVKIKVDDWFEMNDNPRQRDTKTHAKKALRLHLKEYSETHASVAAAELPDGTRYILDGHTRSFLWQSGDLIAPKMLYCDLYIVQSIKQVISLYDCFDNSSAAETATDRLSGALKLNGVNLKSKLVKAGGMTNALKTVYSLKKRGLRGIDVCEPVKLFKKALNVIDKGMFMHTNFPSPVLAAMLLTAHRDGAKVLPFWKDYNEDQGKKTPKKFDAVYCLTEFVRDYRADGGFAGGSVGAVHEATPKIIRIYEAWGSMMTIRPKDKSTLDDVVHEYCGDIYKNMDRQP